MNILLVLAEHPETVEAVRAGADPGAWRIVHRTDLAMCEPLLVHGLAQACLLDARLNEKGILQLEQLLRWNPHCSVIVCSDERLPEWEEKAYLKGASYVIPKPVRPVLFGELLRRMPSPQSAISPDETSFTVIGNPPPQPAPIAPSGTQGLALLRGFSGILTHSLNGDALLRQFLLFVRELFGLNRAMIFLSDPGDPSARRLRAASSLGVSGKLLETIELSFDSGLGQLVSRTGRIVRRHSSQLASAPDARREFDVLGAEVAVPIPDRENVIGVALFDVRVTGEALANAELELLFHLLEQLGLGLRNIALHEQLASNSRMLSGVLRELSSGCVVVDRDLRVLHANKAARRFFPCAAGSRAREFDFDDLPQELGAKVYQVLHTGTAVVGHRFETGRQKVYHVNIAPFQSRQDGSLASVLLMAEDLTQAEHLRRLEVEAAELRLIKPMADRLSAEIGNAAVPIPVIAQLLMEKFSEAAFRELIKDAGVSSPSVFHKAAVDTPMMHESLMGASRRIERLVNQMRFLLSEIGSAGEPIILSQLIEESNRDASRHHKNHKPRPLQVDDPFYVQGDRAMLKFVFMEVLLNALQAAKGDSAISIRVARESDSSPLLKIEVEDSGEGFTPEAARRATEPFYTTKTVGVGLGLTVARRVFEAHGGRIEIPEPGKGRGGLVWIFLPGGKIVPDRKKKS